MQQFTEIFTEEGRKNVRIKHVVPGQAPRVTCTPGMQRAHQQVLQKQLEIIIFLIFIEEITNLTILERFDVLLVDWDFFVFPEQ